MAKISDSIKGFDKLKTRREKFNAVMNHENGGHSKSKALTKAKEGSKQHTPMDLENKERNHIYRKNLKESHIKHLHGEY